MFTEPDVVSVLKMLYSQRGSVDARMRNWGAPRWLSE